MIDALRYEWFRISTIRSTYWISGITILLGVGLSFLISMGTSFAMSSGEGPTGEEIEFLAPAIATQFAAATGPYIVAYIVAVIGVFAWGHEYRHGMIRATLTANGSRLSVWVAKYVVLAGWVLAVVLVTMLLSTLAGWVWLQDDGVRFLTSDLVEQVGRTLVYTLCFVWIAASAASLLRHQTAAMVAIFLWPLALEPLIRLILIAIPRMDDLEKLSRYLPFNAGDRVMRSTDVGRALDTLLGGGVISAWTGFVVFAGFTAALMAASYTLFDRRDA
jgi:ABC-2 type transport system permease protein